MGHRNAGRDLFALTLSHNGTLLAVNGRNGIELWDLRTGTMKREVKLEEKQAAESLIFVEKDRWIAVATATTLPVESPKQKSYKYRHEVGIWSTASGKFVKSMRGQTEAPRFPISAAPPHALLSVDYEDTLRIWNLKTGQLEASWATPPGHPSGDGKLLLREGTAPGRLELWKIGSPDSEAREFVYRSPLCAEPFVGGRDDRKPEFKGLITANGWIENDETFTRVSYVAPDCSLVDTTLSDFKTPEGATQYLERLAAKAAEVIETGLPKDAWERVFLGKRMVVRFAGRRSSPGLFVVMWVEGRYFHQISSMSLPLALAMEREYFPKKPRTNP